MRSQLYFKGYSAPSGSSFIRRKCFTLLRCHRVAKQCFVKAQVTVIFTVISTLPLCPRGRRQAGQANGCCWEWCCPSWFNACPANIARRHQLQINIISPHMTRMCKEHCTNDLRVLSFPNVHTTRNKLWLKLAHDSSLFSAATLISSNHLLSSPVFPSPLPPHLPCLDNITAYYFSYFHPSLFPYRPVSQAVMCDLELSLTLWVLGTGVRWLVY